MSKYYLLLVVILTLLLTRIFATQIQGGLRFSGNEKLTLKDDSIFRKILLKRNNRDYPLKIYKVAPFMINLVLICIVLLLYVLYWCFNSYQIGVAIGGLLESGFAHMFSIIWFLLTALYIGIIQAM